MCYGGGFGTMPAFAADYFGRMSVLLMVSCSPPGVFASALGPLLIAYMQQFSGTYRGALHVIAGMTAVSMILPLIVSPTPASGGQSSCSSPTTQATSSGLAFLRMRLTQLARRSWSPTGRR